MSLANIQGKLSRNEMKKILAGSGSTGSCPTEATSCSNVSCQASTGATGKCGLVTINGYILCGCIVG